MPRGGLLVGVGDAEEGGFPERFSEQLKTDGKLGIGRETTGQAEPGNPRQIAGDGEDVAEVHLEGVLSLLPDLEGGGGGGGRDDGIDALEGVEEVLSDQGSHLLRAEVIGVVVTAAEHVGAEDDAAFDFGAEPRAAGEFVHFGRIAAGDAGAVADAVEAGEVGGGFGGSDDVIGGDGELAVREGDLFDRGAERLELPDGGVDGVTDLGIETADHEFLGHAEAESAEVGTRGEFTWVVGYGFGKAGGIARVVSGDDLGESGGVADGFGEGSDLVEGRGEGDETVARDAAVGGFDADATAEGGGLPDGAAGVGAEGGDAFVGGDGGGAAAGGATGDAGGIPGVAGGEEGGVFGGTAHGELVHVKSAEENGAGLAEALDDGGVVGGAELAEDLGAAVERMSPVAEHVFEGDGHAEEGLLGVGGARRQGAVGGVGLGEGVVGIVAEEGFYLAVDAGDLVETRLGDVACRAFPPGQP